MSSTGKMNFVLSLTHFFTAGWWRNRFWCVKSVEHFKCLILPSRLFITAFDSCVVVRKMVCLAWIELWWCHDYLLHDWLSLTPPICADRTRRARSVWATWQECFTSWLVGWGWPCSWLWWSSATSRGSSRGEWRWVQLADKQFTHRSHRSKEEIASSYIPHKLANSVSSECALHPRHAARCSTSWLCSTGS